VAIRRVAHGLRTYVPVFFVIRVKILLEGVEGDRRILRGVGVTTHADMDEVGTKNQIKRAATVH